MQKIKKKFDNLKLWQKITVIFIWGYILASILVLFINLFIYL